MSTLAFNELMHYSFCTMFSIVWNIWLKLFKNEPSKTCGSQPLKNFTCSIFEYFAPYLFWTFNLGCSPTWYPFYPYIMITKNHWGYQFNYSLVFMSSSMQKPLVVQFEPEAVPQRYSCQKVLWKYATNLEENTHGGAWFQSICFANL